MCPQPPGPTAPRSEAGRGAGVLLEDAPCRRSPPKRAGGVNIAAFLDVLAWSEGTARSSQPTKDRGYDVLMGGQLFNGYADLPRLLVDLPKLKIQSAAAGRYKLLRRYCYAFRKSLGLKDFSPLSQGPIALQQIRERRALPLIPGRQDSGGHQGRQQQMGEPAQG